MAQGRELARQVRGSGPLLWYGNVGIFQSASWGGLLRCKAWTVECSE